MTRNEFDQIDNFDDLKDVAYENGYYDFGDSIITDLDSEVDDDIANCDYGWRELRDLLSGIDDRYYFYYRDGSFDYRGIDDDFDDWKEELREMMEDNGEFEDDEEEENAEASFEDPDPADGELPQSEEEVPSIFWNMEAAAVTVHRDVIDLEEARKAKAASLSVPSWA